MKGQIYDMKDFTTAKEKERAILLCERLNSLSLTPAQEILFLRGNVSSMRIYL